MEVPITNIELSKIETSLSVIDVPDNSIITLTIQSDRFPQELEPQIKTLHLRIQERFPTCFFVVFLNPPNGHRYLFEAITEEQMNKLGWYRKE